MKHAQTLLDALSSQKTSHIEFRVLKCEEFSTNFKKVNCTEIIWR